ncbi:MAG: methyltransferase [Pseudomonadota bacterium]
MQAQPELEKERKTHDSRTMAAAPQTTSSDTLYEGAVSLRQPARGYRVNVDALLLAAFAAQGRPAKFAIDLGSGVGSVALGLQHLGAARCFALVEREQDLLTLAGENAERAGLNAQLWCVDLAEGLPSGLRQRADLVVCNPPFFDPTQTRPSREPGKASARFGDLEPFLAAAAAAVSGARTRVAFVYPARELNGFLAAAGRVHLVPKRLRLVHADANSSARVALLELRRAKPGGLEVLPPLFEWHSKGVRTPELERVIAGAALSVTPRAGGRK